MIYYILRTDPDPVSTYSPDKSPGSHQHRKAGSLQHWQKIRKTPEPLQHWQREPTPESWHHLQQIRNTSNPLNRPGGIVSYL